MQNSLQVLAQKLRSVILLLSIGQKKAREQFRFKREQRNRLRFLMGARPTPQCKVACVQGWEEFVAVVFNLLYSLLFLSWARIPEGGMCSSFRSCLFHAVSIPGQALPLRGVACSCPAAVTMAKCNLEKEQRTHSGSGSIPRNQFG